MVPNPTGHPVVSAKTATDPNPEPRSRLDGSQRDFTELLQERLCLAVGHGAVVQVHVTWEDVTWKSRDLVLSFVEDDRFSGVFFFWNAWMCCLLYTSPSPRDA